MFNEVVMVQDVPHRVWVERENGHYLIAPDGLMRFHRKQAIALLARADAAQNAAAFPVQDVPRY